MGRINRYDTTGMIEDQYEPGTRKRILKNIPGIKKKRELEDLESSKLFETTDKLIRIYDRDHRFTAEDICFMHKLWLGSIYEWAGRYHQVMISKGGFPFASPDQIPRLMNELQQDVLEPLTPCIFKDHDKIIQTNRQSAHANLTLFHPSLWPIGQKKIITFLRSFPSERNAEK